MKGVWRRFDATLGAIEEIDGGRGGIRVDARLARTGIQTYLNEDGTERREYRDPKEVFNQDALSSYADATLTVGHPGIIDSSDWRNHAVGHIRNARQDGETFVAGKVVIKDRATIDAVKSRKLRELSVGYLTEYDPTPGVAPDGARFDGRQKNIRANHIALLPTGHARGGSDLVLRLDSHGNEVAAHAADRKRKTTMEQSLRLDGIAFGLETEAERAAAVRAVERMQAEHVKNFGAEKARADSATTDAAAQKTRADSLAAENATLKTQLAEAQDPKRLDARVVERTELLERARAVHPEVKCDGKTDAEVRREVVAYARPDVKLDGRSDDRIAGMFDALTGDPEIEAARADSTERGINRTVRADALDSTASDGRYREDELDEFAAADRSLKHNQTLARPQRAEPQPSANAGN